MRVILLQDVAKVGRRHEVKEVADGFARNFIIPRGLGQVADSKNLAKLETLKARAAGEQALNQELLNKLLAKLAETKLTIIAKANPAGHLFAQVHAKDIAAALQVEHRVNIAPEQIILETPIRTVGEHQFKIKLPDQTTSTFLMMEVRPS